MAMAFLRRVGEFCACLCVVFGLSLCAACHGQGLPANGIVGDIYTYAGVGQAGETPTTLESPGSMTFDKAGNLYVCDVNTFVKKITPQGVISNYVSNAGCIGIAMDASGNLYASTAGKCQIVKITPALAVTVVAGTYGVCTVTTGTASTATIGLAANLAFDGAGNLYISTQPTGQAGAYVLKVALDGANGIDGNSLVSIVAGTATAGYNGDNQPAIQAELNGPAGIAFDAMGNLYIADQFNYRVRMVGAGGTISTIAGNGILGYANGSVGAVSGVQWDATTGNVYVSDIAEQVVYAISVTGVTRIYAGTGLGAAASSGSRQSCQNYYVADQVPATSAPLSCPYGVAVDGLGNVYIDDTFASRTRVVIAPPLSPCGSPGDICTIAGNGAAAFAGDGGPATSASLYTPNGLYVDASNNIFVADSYNNRVRVFTSGGSINTIAGNGFGPNINEFDEESGDGGPATQAILSYPGALSEDNSGNLYILDEIECCGGSLEGANPDYHSAIRVVSLSTGIISNFLGESGCVAFSVDLAFGANEDSNLGIVGPGLYSSSYFGPATDCSNPDTVAFISSLSSQIGSSTQMSSAINTGGVADYLAIDYESNVYFSAAPPATTTYTYSLPGVNTAQMLDPYGNITTAAGSGSQAYSGDGGLAINAGMTPGALAVDSAGDLFIVDLSVNAVRVVIAPNDPSVPNSGYIYTIAGSPALAAGFSGDGGPATSAQLNAPGGIKVDAQGNLYISDSANNRVRMVSNPAAGPAWPTSGGTPPGGPVLPGGGCTPTPHHPCAGDE